MFQKVLVQEPQRKISGTFVKKKIGASIGDEKQLICWGLSPDTNPNLPQHNIQVRAELFASLNQLDELAVFHLYYCMCQISFSLRVP